MNIQRKNSAHHFRMQSEREQTLGSHYRASEVVPFCFQKQYREEGETE